jgi:ABC-type phosphate/phosphonate transport system substrate-binding protein
VRQEAPWRRLEDSFGGRSGWTVAHSHSGFNAWRHHLLRLRTRERPTLYREMTGSLITARTVLDSVREGRIDVAPLDAYWHLLIARHAPHLTQGIRVLDSTELAPIPAFVAAAGTPRSSVARLQTAFEAAATRPWFAQLAEPLLLEGFAAVDEARYAPLLEWAREAEAAGYALPA